MTLKLPPVICTYHIVDLPEVYHETSLIHGNQFIDTRLGSLGTFRLSYMNVFPDVPP